MGQEFCNGCQDCTNFKGFEGDFSYFGNKPLTHLNNPTYENTNVDNSIFNIKTEYPNDNSIMCNGYVEYYSNLNQYTSYINCPGMYVTNLYNYEYEKN